MSFPDRVAAFRANRYKRPEEIAQKKLPDIRTGVITPEKKPSTDLVEGVEFFDLKSGSSVSPPSISPMNLMSETSISEMTSRSDESVTLSKPRVHFEDPAQRPITMMAMNKKPLRLE